MKIRNKLIAGFGAVSLISLMVISLIGYFTAKALIRQFVFENVENQIKTNADTLKIQYSTTLRKLETDLGIVYNYFINPSSGGGIYVDRGSYRAIPIVSPSSNTAVAEFVPTMYFRGQVLDGGNQDVHRLSEYIFYVNLHLVQYIYRIL